MTNGRVVAPWIAAALTLTSLPACCMWRGRTPSTETITIAGPGFAPDPTTSSAQAGGSMEASTLAPSANCVGSIPAAPQHTVRLGAALPLLRVLVNSSEDLTLVVRAPDGTFHCNDDSADPANGLNPLVEISNAQPGEYSVYVGAYSESAILATYSIGFTATPGTFPSAVVR